MNQPTPTKKDGFFFNEEVFLAALKGHCRDSCFVPIQVWRLAKNIFAAMMYPENNSTLKPTIFFYFDEREVKLRNKSSSKQQMNREIESLMKSGLLVSEPFSEGVNDYLRIVYFYYNYPAHDPEKFINYILKLFTKINGDEVEWCTPAEGITFSRMDLY